MMNKVHTSVRIKQIMEERNLRQSDIVRLCQPYSEQYNVRLGKNDLSQYLSQKAEPGQRKLFVLAKALNVNPTWLMGLKAPKEPKEEKEKKNDAITDIILRLRSDDDFREVVTNIYVLPSEQFEAVKTFLSAFKQ